MPGKLENAEVWKPKYGNGSMETEVRRFPLVLSCPVHMFLLKFGHLYECTGLHSKHVEGWAVTATYDVRADITVNLQNQQNRKQNQEINKTGTLSHGVSEVTILQKL